MNSGEASFSHLILYVGRMKYVAKKQSREETEAASDKKTNTTYVDKETATCRYVSWGGREAIWVTAVPIEVGKARRQEMDPGGYQSEFIP